MNLAGVRDLPDFVPITWSNGVGVNSAAVACLLAEWGVKVSLVTFADTGGEFKDTIDYIPVLNEFLGRHGLPEITVVRKRSKYASLYDNCLSTDTLPSKAYGGGSCSEKWKVEPQRYHMNRWKPARDCWARGLPVVKIIGYDYGDRDQQRYAESTRKVDPKVSYWCPLQEMKLDREACKAVIRNAGLPVPRKSSCYFCPAMRRPEIRELARDNPELFERAITLEVNAVQGKHGLRSTRGLGRSWSWLEYLAGVSPSFAEDHAEELELMESHGIRRNA